METKLHCPSCGKPLAPNVPLGLCPECLIKSGFPTGTEPAGSKKERLVPPPIAELAHRFPHLDIIALIGQGGMGAVYKARQPALDRFVALKILPPGNAGDPGYQERFTREARALARLNHPNIVAVYDFGQADGQPFLVMEFVDGLNLREVERAGSIPPEQALQIVPQVCEALQFAHSEGVVHRDIKPENILLDKKGRVKITDFGIAKILGVAEGKISLTGAKDLIGTPHYMAPEQIERPRSVDHRADIYSLGVVFYELLTGELPLGKFQPPSRKARIDVRLDEVVLQALEKEPERRYQHASQLKTDVETISGSGGKVSGKSTSWPGKTPDPEERRRKFLLWYGMVAAGIGLLYSISQKLFFITGVCIGGLIIGAWKMGLLHQSGPKAGGAQQSPGAASGSTQGRRLSGRETVLPLWRVTASLTVVSFFSLLVLVVAFTAVVPMAGTLTVALILVLLLALPFAVIISHRFAKRWFEASPGDRLRSSQWLKAFGWIAVGLTLLVGGFGIFFVSALVSERGAWHPVLEEAIVVTLSWVGLLLLPAAAWGLLAAGAGPATLSHVKPGRTITLCMLTVSLVVYAIVLHRRATIESRNTANSPAGLDIGASGNGMSCASGVACIAQATSS